MLFHALYIYNQQITCYMSWWCHNLLIKIFLILIFLSEVVFEKAYCEYRLNRVESSLKTIEGAPEQTDKLKELYGQVVRQYFWLKAAKYWYQIM